MTFSEYINKLYPFYGNGKSQQDFFIALISAAVKDDNHEFFDKKDYLNRVFSGAKPFPKKFATYILTNLEKEGLDNTFLNDIPSNDALIELCEEFEPYVGVSTMDTIATKLSDLFVNILKEIINKKKAIKPKNFFVQTENINNEDIERELSKIVTSLSKLSQQDIDVILRFDPLNVDTKIPKDNILKNDIRNDVHLYYNYINDLLTEASKTNSVLVDRLTKAVQFASDNYIAQGISQQQIIKEMIQWLKLKAMSSNDTACKILVSFFVQNCEVFYETAK